MFMFMKGADLTQKTAYILDTEDMQCEKADEKMMKTIRELVRQGSLVVHSYKEQLYLDWVKHITKTNFDKVFETYNTPDFTEIVGRSQGSVLTLRVYRKGWLTER